VPKPAAKPAPSFIEEFLGDTPLWMVGGAAVVVLGGIAALIAARRRKTTKFEDSIISGTDIKTNTVFGSTGGGVVNTGDNSLASDFSREGLGSIDTDEVDPIAEAEVYLAYGRDAQAEEILKEALAKDANRTAVHAKLLEIYANRKDTRSFEQSALKLKSLTNGAGPEWDKALGLGRSIDPQNGLYGGGGGVAAPAAAPAAALAAAAAAPTLDFDLGGATTPGSTDISLDAPSPKQEGGSIDFDLGAAASATTPGTPASDFTPEGTLIMDQKSDSTGGLDFDLGLGGGAKPAAPAAPASDSTGGLDFDLNLDSGDKSADKATQPAPSMDLSSISLDLGETTPGATAGGGDPKWQEVATKLDLAKAYEEMGDKDGARELLNEVMKDGDAAQKGQAQQLLAKIS
jgi:pilus assembly protein FimV